ncbi:flavin-containing monooxygenase [Sphingomonas colocasiae]|uniref:NAD(P)/FAD-dependent oxidoreductase n=1 Tax=Sphingomonas colocasiae TaxID=1848973 RepID=A0ABS7PJR5_9SPHN|nr:NAD(P)/FAD-dependent oxidoreductase [Sphingomonas colocasiae]MBY8821532.1 NAD(P)/FAD-dependent oxidoreductase [Sphingomonas colocasiae]
MDTPPPSHPASHIPAADGPSDKAGLVEAMKAADSATLLLVLVQLTGERHWLERARPYISGPMNYQEKMPDQLRAEIREALLAHLLAFAGDGREWPPIPEGALLEEMLSTAVGEPIGRDYAAMMHQDLDPDHYAPAEPGPFGQGGDAPIDMDAVIIGAGMSGIAAAIYLQQAGIPFTILEKDAAFGGTWYQNRYPGCGVDTPNHFYSYSFEPNNDWSHFFAKRDELWRYFEDVADRHRLRPHTRFGTEVISATYDETSARWTVVFRERDGATETVTARVVISAVGVLNRPKWPEIEGLESFGGTLLHSGAWDPDFDWRGKRIAMIGTGASGHQIAPTIAPDVAELTIFQRSPHWVVPNPNYFLGVSEGKKWALEHIPFYARWYRFQLFWAFADGLHDALRVDPGWNGDGRSINAANDRHRAFMERFIESELGEGSPLIPKVLPDYPPYGKRILIDNRWYAMLRRDNVALVTDDIVAVRPEGVETADGIVHEVDAIVCATGFQASRMLAPMEIVGRDGVQLRKIWKPDDATAYLGTMMPGFPNFFTLLGPNTSLAHGGNAIFVTECQMRFVMLCIKQMLDGGHEAAEVTDQAHDAYVEDVDRLHDGMVWSYPGVKSWYRNPAGRVFAVLPYRLVDFWKMTGSLDPAAIRFGGGGRPAPDIA